MESFSIFIDRQEALPGSHYLCAVSRTPMNTDSGVHVEPPETCALCKVSSQGCSQALLDGGDSGALGLQNRHCRELVVVCYPIVSRSFTY